MDFYKLSKKRRSIRNFQNKLIEPEKIEQLLSVLKYIPSSRSIFPIEFIVVQEKQLLKQLAKSKDHGSAFLEFAPAAAVIITDSEKSDVWIEDASIAATFLMLGAVDLGLGSCWIQIRKRQKESKSSEEIVKELLNISKKYRVEAIIALGYPDQDKITPKLKSFDMSKIYTNKQG